MDTRVLRRFLFWCLVLNFILLAVWFGMFSLAGDWVYRLHGTWFPMPRETFSAIHYAGLAFYKSLVLVFNAIPLLALLVVERSAR